MSKWLRAMNPLMKPRGMAEAQWAAQSFAFALVISFCVSIPGSIWLASNPTWMGDLLRQQYEAQGLPAEEVEMATALLGYIMPVSMMVGIIFMGALMGVLAWVQWRKMTRAIPAIWLAYTAYGVVMSIAGQALGYSPVGVVPPLFPTWITAVSSLGTAVVILVGIASLRGAIMLHRLRREP